MTDAPKPKVLIIEDNAVNAKLLTIFLETGGFEVIHAHDGYTGLEMARSQPGIAAILLDRIMPDMDGLEVLRALKLSAQSYNTPVIMLTAALSAQQIEEAKIVGAYDCLRKPYDKDKIINTVNAAMKSRQKH
jgi:CheY-like chemotaxis protein